MTATGFEYPTREHPFAPFVRILGKGKSGSRSLSRAEARQAFGMILRGEVEAVQVGAFLMLLRVKEETGEELAGFVEACRDRLPAEDYAVLKRTMDYQESCVRVWRYHTEAYFRYRLYALNVPGATFSDLVTACNQCRAEIRKLRLLDEDQADIAQALPGNLISLAWVQGCRTQSHPKGILPDREADGYQDQCGRE